MKNKLLSIILLICFGMVCAAAGFFYANVIIRKNQSIGAANKLQYENKFIEAVNNIVEGTRISMEIAERVSEKWRGAINDGKDFNSELTTYYKELATPLKGLENNNSEVISKMQALKAYPIEYKEAYETLLELYQDYSQIYLLAQSPSGSLMSYNSKANDLASQFYKILSKLKIYMPKISA